MLFRIKMVIKLLASYLLLKLELSLNETCKTPRRTISAKTLISSSLVKVETNKEILPNGRFRKNFRNSEQTLQQ